MSIKIETVIIIFETVIIGIITGVVVWSVYKMIVTAKRNRSLGRGGNGKVF